MRNVVDSNGTESEIDLRSYFNRILARWWVVAIFIVLAIIGSFTIQRTQNKNLTRAVATVYLGQPISPNGSLVPNPLSSNPLFANALAHQATYQEPAARKAGLEARALGGNVSVELISTAVGVKGTAVPLAQVIVQGPFTAPQSAAAANALADAIVAESNTYTDAKKVEAIAARDRLRTRLDQLAQSGTETQARLDALETAALSPAERSSLTTPLIAMLQFDSNTEAILTDKLPDLETQVDYIENVESASVITPARGSKVAPTSKQFSLFIALVLGFLVGILAAILSTVFWPVHNELEAETTTTP